MHRYGGVTYSQHGEDIAIVDIFAQLGIDNPTYLDIGAHHPDDISTTKLLYERGSRGVNVEANPHLIAKFRERRSDEINLQLAVGPRELAGQKSDFYMFDDHSGLNTLSVADAEIFRRQSGRAYNVGMQVQVACIGDLIDAYFPNAYPQFINCDIEGYDFAVMSELNNGRQPRSAIVVCIEVRQHDSYRFTEMMNEKGYAAHARMGENIIYVRDDCDAILSILRGC